MKAMDEFGSVLAIAALLLGACAVVDGLGVAADAGTVRADKAYSGYRTTQPIAVSRQDMLDLAASGKALEVAVTSGEEVASAARPVPVARMSVAQQAQLSW